MRIPSSQIRGAAAGFLLILSSVAGAADAKLPGAEIAGHWLSVDYMKAIEKSRSPLGAVAETNLVALLVDAAEEGPPGYTFSVTSFHEGLNYRILGYSEQGGIARIEADSFDDDSDASQTLLLQLMAAPDGARLAAGTLWGEERVVYRRLPATVSRYVNELTVAGEYVDAAMKTYVFGPDGRLDWAGKKRAYEVTIDTYENSCDTLSYSESPDGELVFVGFRRGGSGELSLYQLVEGQEHMFDCAVKPFLVLHPKSKP